MSAFLSPFLDILFRLGLSCSSKRKAPGETVTIITALFFKTLDQFLRISFVAVQIEGHLEITGRLGKGLVRPGWGHSRM